MDKYKVNLRGGFSDRSGIKTINTDIQFKNLDNRTRVAIYNELTKQYINSFGSDYYSTGRSKNFWDDILSNVYTQMIARDNHKYITSSMFAIIEKTIINDEYDDVLTLVEYIVNKYILMFPFSKKDYIAGINAVFENEYVGYRFINNMIVPITDEIEISEIKQSISTEYERVSTRLSKALRLLSDRNSPDYENSIKESITAVESICSIVTGEESTLGKALAKLESKGIVIHGSLKAAFNSLYGYTSDAAGIRHAGKLDGPKATFEEAKYMIVSCSAFINYITGQLAKS